MLFLFLLGDLGDDAVLAVDLFQNICNGVLIVESFALVRRGIRFVLVGFERRFQCPVFLRFEVANRKLAIDEHLERRRLHPPDAEYLAFGMLVQRHGNRQIDADHPVGDPAHPSGSLDILDFLIRFEL